MNITTALGQALAIATQDTSTFERAEACYQAKFRSEAYSLQSITNFDWLEDVKAEIMNEYRAHTLKGLGVTLLKPVYDQYGELTNESDLENQQELIDSIIVDIPPQTLVCDLCNYKGEGEGISLYEFVKDLPIFRSKSASFEHFGA